MVERGRLKRYDSLQAEITCETRPNGLALTTRSNLQSFFGRTELTESEQWNI